MYDAIVFLPLLGAVIAALISLAGARARHPGGAPAAGAEDHAAPVVERGLAAPSPEGEHAVLHPSPAEIHADGIAAIGSRAAEVVTTVLLFGSMLLAWFAFADIGFAH